MGKASDFTGYFDNNDNKIFVGDKLRNKNGVYVIVVKVSNNNFKCQLIQRTDFSKQLAFYPLNEGKGYYKIYIIS